MVADHGDSGVRVRRPGSGSRVGTDCPNADSLASRGAHLNDGSGLRLADNAGLPIWQPTYIFNAPETEILAKRRQITET